MRYLKWITGIAVVAMILFGMKPAQASAAKPEYGLVIVSIDEDGSMDETYDGTIIKLSPKNNIMVKAEVLCEDYLDLTYSYDKKTKKITIKNKENGKSLVYTIGSKEYTYYSGKSAKGITKTAVYPPYIDSGACLIHAATLQYVAGYKYYDLKDTSYYNDEYSQYLTGIVYFSKYDNAVPTPIPTPMPEFAVADIDSDKIPDDQVVQIEDEHLKERIIRELRGEDSTEEGDLTFGELKELRSFGLPLYTETTKSLKGLEYAVNLESLKIVLDDYIDPQMFNYISKLKNLKSISIEENSYTGTLNDISFLEGCTNLNKVELQLFYSIHTNFKCDVLGKLKKLKTLQIRGYEGINLDFLKQLPNLKELELSQCKISDINVLKNLKKLTVLDLWVNDIDDKDLQVVKYLPDLEELVIGGCAIRKDISVLLNLHKLKYLNYSGTEFEKNDVNIDTINKLRKQLVVLTLNTDYYDIGLGEVKSKDKPMSKLTDEIVKRLQSHPMSSKPMSGYEFNTIGEQYPDTQQFIYDTFMEHVKLEKNEKMFISKDLTYMNTSYTYFVRFVLQTTNKDGSIEEVDMEYSFFMTGWGDDTYPMSFTGFREISDVKIMKAK